MLDDLREKTSDKEFFEEMDEGFETRYESDSSNSKLFFGMTPIQRFVIAVMILLMVCVMGLFLLLVTERVYFPFV